MPTRKSAREGSTRSAARFAILYFLLPIAFLVVIALLEHRR
jgi:hypothetical protein